MKSISCFYRLSGIFRLYILSRCDFCSNQFSGCSLLVIIISFSNLLNIILTTITYFFIMLMVFIVFLSYINITKNI